ncbi:hypothetical protein JOD57_001603 [Geodermatophilus bullaregiensis]|uniref:DUF6653 family protein n=1 Tax=Geodermatophilus bullaregiensis TaxID=1564160 RepID=UPI0019571E08|nr:DUF6653 family protein [Geodermatophilus bullaregiensis]MBM7805766.1 hypothetical protein [Geodermatophilus bullaregiensis]
MAMDVRMAKAFGLEGDAWQRHANPWSVYTRIPIPPLLVAAIWSRTRIGWRSLVPVGAVCAWTLVNPRAFPPPRSLDHWASRGVLGETYWARREEVPVPPRHRVAPNVLGVVSALGVPFIVRGLVVRDGWMVLFGLAVQMAGKVWFIDRMAILYDDVVPARAADDTPAPRGAQTPQR